VAQSTAIRLRSGLAWPIQPASARANSMAPRSRRCRLPRGPAGACRQQHQAPLVARAGGLRAGQRKPSIIEIARCQGPPPGAETPRGAVPVALKTKQPGAGGRHGPSGNHSHAGYSHMRFP